MTQPTNLSQEPNEKRLRKPQFSPLYWKVLKDKRLNHLQKNLHAIILGFCDAEADYCFASNAYLAELIGLHVRNLIKNLSKLEECGYIYRKDVEVEGITHRRIFAYLQVGSDASARGGGANATGGGDASATHTIQEGLLEKNISKEIYKKSPPKKKELKTYGEYKRIKLTDAQLKELESEYDPSTVAEAIEGGDRWLEQEDETKKKL